MSSKGQEAAFKELDSVAIELVFGNMELSSKNNYMMNTEHEKDRVSKDKHVDDYLQSVEIKGKLDISSN